MAAVLEGEVFAGTDAPRVVERPIPVSERRLPCACSGVGTRQEDPQFTHEAQKDAVFDLHEHCERCIAKGGMFCTEWLNQRRTACQGSTMFLFEVRLSLEGAGLGLIRSMGCVVLINPFAGASWRCATAVWFEPDPVLCWSQNLQE